MEFIPRYFQPPSGSYYLFGPRGTGKSAWTQRYYRESLRIDLLQPDTLRRFRARPERIREIVHAQPEGKAIIIDEVQRVPELLSAVHGLIEEKRGWIFVLTGSSARKLRRAGIDLLAGRAAIRTLHPFMAAELGAIFNLTTSLEAGLLPLVLDSERPQEVLDSYIDTYMREEAQTEGLVRNLGGFSRFLESISFSHGQILNISNVARECEVERKTVEGYLSVLEDLLLCFRLPVFRKRAGRVTVKHHKFFLFDTGIFRSIRPLGPLDRPEEIAGPALEGLVAQNLRAWTAYTQNRHELYYLFPASHFFQPMPAPVSTVRQSHRDIRAR
jgi:predicted AAA+ superfamily ATPase